MESWNLKIMITMLPFMLYQGKGNHNFQIPTLYFRLKSL